MKFIGDIMKRPNQILSIAFLLVLFIVPMIFAVSATEYSVSEQSITLFDETLPNDVLFFPDVFINGTVINAIDGSENGTAGYVVIGDYVRTDTRDAFAYSVSDGIGPSVCQIYLNFTVPYVEYQIEFLDIASYNDISTGTGNVSIWNHDSDSWTILSNVPAPYGSYSWCNSTVYDPDYWTGGIVWLKFDTADDANTNVRVDYAEITVGHMTLADDEHYAESFSDVSDWEVHTGNTITTDGDVATFTTEGDDAYNIYYCNAPSQSFQNYYLEFRYSVNDTDADKLGISLKSEDSYLGDIIYSLGFFHSTTDYETHKVLIKESGVVESIAILIKDDDGDAPIAFNFDYLRISPANESGYQDDCSTVAHTTALRVDVESDGDHIQFQYSGGGGTGELSFHTDIGGSNIAAIDTNYYPFIGWNVVNLTDDYYEVYADNTLVYTGTGLGLQHVNVEASGEVEYTTITFVLHTVTESMALDWIKGYSIANYTVTQSGTSIDDVLYVSSGTLYCEGTSFTSIVLAYDPVLSFETERSMWTMTTSSGTPEIDFYFDAWLGYTSNTEGDFPDGTLTDFRIKFTDSANVEAITFLSPIPQWNIVGEAELIFSVPIDESGLDMMLIFLGLLMIPASTLYLVKGGRSEASMDKLFFGLIAFVLGWALFLGGIM